MPATETKKSGMCVELPAQHVLQLEVNEDVLNGCMDLGEEGGEGGKKN